MRLLHLSNKQQKDSEALSLWINPREIESIRVNDDYETIIVMRSGRVYKPEDAAAEIVDDLKHLT